MFIDKCNTYSDNTCFSVIPRYNNQHFDFIYNEKLDIFINLKRIIDKGSPDSFTQLLLIVIFEGIYTNDILFKLYSRIAKI